MAKSKTTKEDFARFLEDSEEPAAFSRNREEASPVEINSGNLGQTSDNPKTEPRTILGQTQDKPRTGSSQLARNLGQTSDNPKTEPRTHSRTILGQTQDKPRTISTFQGLSGLQKNLMDLLYQICLSKGGRTTGPVSIELFSKTLQSTRLSIQKSIQRLEHKKVLERKESRSGRGGWTVYEIPEIIWNEILQIETSDKLRTNLGQTSDKPKTEPRTQPRTNVSSSSSRELFFKESSTTQAQALAQLSDELGTLDLTQLQNLGITTETFKRALQLHPSVSVEALHDLAFRLSELFKNPKERAKIQNARGFVIKLVEQLASGITPLDHIETSTDRLMREYAALAKQKREEQAGFEETLLQEAFEKWDREFSEDEKLSAVPLAKNAPKGSPRTAVLRQHFRENIWPVRREEMIQGDL